MSVLRWRVSFILCRPDRHHRIHCARPPPLSNQDGGIELHCCASRRVAASPRGHYCRRYPQWRFAQWVVLESGGSWTDQSGCASVRVCLKERWCAGWMLRLDVAIVMAWDVGCVSGGANNTSRAVDHQRMPSHLLSRHLPGFRTVSGGNCVMSSGSQSSRVEAQVWRLLEGSNS
jgi:hypothetical protein